MTLDFSPLSKALGSLTRAVARSKNEPNDEEVRDAVIQRFEYTYELCWKMLKRQIEAESPAPAEVDRMSFKELMREGGERGMIRDVEAWFEYRESRNITSHTYNEQSAAKVYRSALTFLDDATLLLAELERRNCD